MALILHKNFEGKVFTATKMGQNNQIHSVLGWLELNKKRTTIIFVFISSKNKC